MKLWIDGYEVTARPGQSFFLFCVLQKTEFEGFLADSGFAVFAISGYKGASD